MEEFYLDILCNRVFTIHLGVEDKSSPLKLQVSYEIAVNGNSNCSGWKKTCKKTYSTVPTTKHSIRVLRKIFMQPFIHMDEKWKVKIILFMVL